MQRRDEGQSFGKPLVVYRTVQSGIGGDGQ
jgi:hypothetical protein